MKQIKMKLAAFSVLAIFVVMSLFPSLVRAKPAPFEVIIQVNEHGFLDENGVHIDTYIKIPKDSEIKLIFEHVGKRGEEHEFILLFDSDEEVSSGIISDVKRRASIVFQAGEEEELYDVFCVIVDCDGMEHLTDLVLVAT